MHSSEDQPGRRSKLALLLRLLLKNPVEFRDRVLTVAEFHADRLRPKATIVPMERDALMHQLEAYLGGKLHSFLNEPALSEIENEVFQKQRRVIERPVFETYHDADFLLARLCYALCRLQKPEVVVETGVGYGVTSAFMLQALSMNNKGQLWSIDLSPLAQGADAQVGCLIPASVRSRWHLLRGRTRRLLPPLMAQLSSVDIFLHDSLHTYRNMTWEFRTVWPKLKAGGVLLSDDIDMNRAFEEFATHSSKVELFAAGKQDNKSSLFGIAIKARASRV